VNYKIYVPKVFEPVTLDPLSSNLVSLPSSLMFDRIFTSIFEKRPKTVTVKVRVLSAQKGILRAVAESSEMQNIINSLYGRSERIQFVTRY
jgi:hypothetical protein